VLLSAIAAGAATHPKGAVNSKVPVLLLGSAKLRKLPPLEIGTTAPAMYSTITVGKVATPETTAHAKQLTMALR
jgi:hypothetical protein